MAWKLPQPKQTSQVSFPFLLKQSLGATCSMENTKHFTQPQGLGSARPGNCECSRAASRPHSNSVLWGNCSSFGLGALGQEPPTARSQRRSRYEAMDHQSQPQLEDRQGTHGIKYASPLKSWTAPASQHMAQKAAEFNLRDFSGAPAPPGSKRHTDTPSLYHQDLSLTQVPDASMLITAPVADEIALHHLILQQRLK